MVMIVKYVCTLFCLWIFIFVDHNVTSLFLCILIVIRIIMLIKLHHEFLKLGIRYILIMDLEINIVHWSTSRG